MAFYYTFVDRKHFDERQEVSMPGNRPTRPDTKLEQEAFKHTRFHREGRKLSEFRAGVANHKQKDAVGAKRNTPEPTKGTRKKEEPLKGVRYGTFQGQSGRTRNLYDVQAFKARTTERRENAYAYGRVGVRQAKRHIHSSQAKSGHKALRFHVYNKTRGRWVK